MPAAAYSLPTLPFLRLLALLHPSTHPLACLLACPPTFALPCSYNALLADRAELEARYEARLRGAEQASAAQLAALDGQFQQKLIHEMDRYAELAAGKEALNARWGGCSGAACGDEELHACLRNCRLGASG